mgnify:CR=1 FL=1
MISFLVDSAWIASRMIMALFVYILAVIFAGATLGFIASVAILVVRINGLA